jgi:hypothetical protein
MTDVTTPAAATELGTWFARRQSLLKVVKTTTTPAGKVLDWIPIESQHPQGKIATPPPAADLRVPADDRVSPVSFELDDPRVERGPPGTVPVLRKDPTKIAAGVTLTDYLSKRGGLAVNRARRTGGPADPNPFGYFHATSGQSTILFGCDGWLNVWQPATHNSNDHSIMQCGLQNYDKPQLQSLEAGWTVDPGLNGDSVAHIFTYYTTNGYTQDGDNLGGYNTDVDGWVQYDGSIYPGARINGTSTAGGAQVGVAIKFQLFEDNWWFAVQGRWLGYYPASLYMGNQHVFSTLGDHADWVGFWGEVYSSLANPNNTTDQMGSGRHAEAGWQHACFQKNLRNQSDRNGGMSAHDGTGSAEDSAKYDIQMHMNSGSNWGSYFYAGGPSA